MAIVRSLQFKDDLNGAVYKEHTLSHMLADGPLNQERRRILQELRDCWASRFSSLQQPIYKSGNISTTVIGLMKKRSIWR